MAYVEVLSAIVYDRASYDENTGSVDPVVVIKGEIPGPAKPFGVDRVYRGAQGTYEEAFAILDPDGELLYQHPYGRIRLRGEMYEDRFRDFVTDEVIFDSTDEHTLVLIVQEYEVGRVPIFVDAPRSVRAAGALGEALESTLKKSAIIWLTIPQPVGSQVTKPAWFVLDDGKVFVLTGPGEQDLTNIASADKVTIHTRSKGVQAEVASVPATVRVVDNDSDEFARIAEQGLGTRLNLADGHDAAERWRRTCTMVELTPQI